MSDGLGLALASSLPFSLVQSSFSPLDVAGIAGWWDASDTATLTEISGAVSQWDDKSGLLNHVVQAVANNQPSTGLSTVNGKNVLDFAGGPSSTGDWLQRTGMSNPTIQEWFFVVTVASVQANSGIGGLLSASNDRGNIRTESGSNRRFRYNNSDVIPGAPGDANDLGRLDGQWNPENKTGSVLADLTLPDDTPTRVHCTRGSSITAGGVYDNLRIGGDPIGGGRYLTMKLAELIGYDQVLSAQDRTDLRDYLKDKWGVA